MTTALSDSFFHGAGIRFSDSVSDFFNFPELIGVVVQQRIAQRQFLLEGKTSSDTGIGAVFQQLLKRVGGEVVAIGVAVTPGQLPLAIQAFRSEQIWHDAITEQEILLVDRLKVAPENQSRFSESVQLTADQPFGPPFFLVKKEGGWDLLSDVGLVNDEPDRFIAAHARTIAGKVKRGERYTQFFSLMKNEIGIEVASHVTVTELLKNIFSLVDEREFLANFLGAIEADRDLAHLGMFTRLDTLSWRVLKKLIAVRDRFLQEASDIGRSNVQAEQKMDLAYAYDIKPTVTLEQARREAKNLDVIIPREIVGFERIATFLTIEEELKRFFLSLPAAKIAGEKTKAATLEKVSYRGWKFERILELSIEEFVSHFKNHPKLRTLCAAMSMFHLKDELISQSLSEFSYHTAYRFTVIRELRKVREGSRVYVPSTVMLYGTEHQHHAIKESLKSFLNFYRAQIILYN